MDLRVVVNWAPYLAGSPRSHQQFRATTRFVELAPVWCGLSLARLPREGPPDVVIENASCAVQQAVLPRDAHGAAAGHRHLPFVRDVMDLACEGLGDASWGGFLNSDILVTERFFEAFVAAERAVEVLLVHRTDIRRYETPPEQGQKVNQRTCTDGFFMRAAAWRRERQSYPDFVQGEPWWDTGTIYWAKALQLKTLHLGDHECLHIVHQRYWQRRSAGANHNSMLGKSLWKTKL